ncbi:hypothetical protein Nmel_013925 [Mimus melanotis]
MRPPPETYPEPPAPCCKGTSPHKGAIPAKPFLTSSFFGMGIALLGSSARPISARFCATDLCGSQAWRMCELRGDKGHHGCVPPSHRVPLPTHTCSVLAALPHPAFGPHPPCPRRSPGDAGRGAAAGAAVEPLAVEVVGVFVPPALPLGLRHGGHTRASHGAAARASGHHGKCSSDTAAPSDECARRTATPSIHCFGGGGYGSRKGPLLSPWPWRPGRPHRWSPARCPRSLRRDSRRSSCARPARTPWCPSAACAPSVSWPTE